MPSPRFAPLLLALAPLVAPGCSDQTDLPADALVIYAPQSEIEAVTAFVSLLPQAAPGTAKPARLIPSKEPVRDLSGSRAALAVALVPDAVCAECYRLERDGGRFQVLAGGRLGFQYGLAHLLEEAGYRFFHPSEAHAPPALSAPPASAAFGRPYAPEKSLRGFHAHTLHTIESFYDLLVPGDEGLAGAERLVDWIVKNRGNYLQWIALDKIEHDEGAAAAWRAHTKKVIDYAHMRGLKVGVNPQLFGTSSLQHSFILLRSATESDPAAKMRERFTTLLSGLSFDRVNLSFGEFSGSNPQLFIDGVNRAYDSLQAVAPGTEMTATIHVGNSPKLQVTYDGQTLLYYFLVQFANPAVVPWIHTVMYYDLFEDTGGAYLHEDFHLHRDYLESRLAAHKPVAYFPETAYWVAFDDSVPMYLPLYLRSRFLDLRELRARAGAAGRPDLDQHVLFSSGWEWGYWQNDYAALRMSYALPARFDDELDAMFSPYGPPGQELARAVAELAERQHDALIVHRLAPYLAGRDELIDVGFAMGTIAAQGRVSFDEIAAMSAESRAAFRAQVMLPLDALVAATDQALGRVEASGMPEGDPFYAEIRDGVAVDGARARFIRAAYQAALSYAETRGDGGALADLEKAEADGKAAVAARHGKLHSPRPANLKTRNDNDSLYQYGYLYYADTLCYWERERIQLRSLLFGEATAVPACVL